MPSPHPDNDLIEEKDLIAQNTSFENETATNISESNAYVFVCKKMCAMRTMTAVAQGYSGDMVDCHDLNSAFGDEKVVCEPLVFVPELKQNRFGKFLTEEIPEFVPSSTGKLESEQELNEESSNEDSNTATSKNGEENSSSSEDQGSDDSSKDQKSDVSSDTDDDEACSEDESRIDKKMKKVESSSCTTSDDSSNSSRHSSHTSSSNTSTSKRKEQNANDVFAVVI
ncbi:hypothetical protein Hanom_Chr06g00492811 [Helianthus anomalus]